MHKKVELAELSDSYEHVCHAFLKADAAKYGSILAELNHIGTPMPKSVSVNVIAK